MATTNTRRTPLINGESLQVSLFDRVAGLLTALIMFAATVVATMFFVWQTRSHRFATNAVVAITNVSGESTVTDRNTPELAELDVREAAELIDGASTVPFDSLAQVAAAASSESLAAGETRTVGRIGKDRVPGPELARIGNEIPRWERWEIHYASNSMVEYARQLDYFHIELGVAGGGRSLVDYVSRFSESPHFRAGLPADERRLFMTWNSGRLREFDRRLLDQIHVPSAGRVVMHFYPLETEEQIAAAELMYARQRGIDPRMIQKTIVAVETAPANGYRYRVIEQRYRANSNFKP